MNRKTFPNNTIIGAVDVEQFVGLSFPSPEVSSWNLVIDTYVNRQLNWKDKNEEKEIGNGSLNI